MKRILVLVLAANLSLPAVVFAQGNDSSDIKAIVEIAKQHAEQLSVSDRIKLLDAANDRISKLQDRLNKTSKSLRNGKVEVGIGLATAGIAGLIASVNGSFSFVGSLYDGDFEAFNPAKSFGAKMFWGSIAALVIGLTVTSHGQATVDMSQSEFDSINKQIDMDRAALRNLSDVLARK